MKIKLAQPPIGYATRIFVSAQLALLIVMKLTGWLTWGWAATLSPLWMPPLILFLAVPIGGRLVVVLLRTILWWVW
jgi:hypothetical protein